MLYILLLKIAFKSDVKDPETNVFLWFYIINMKIYQYCKFQKSIICKDITKFTVQFNKGR
jgi:hypothetical protein